MKKFIATSVVILLTIIGYMLYKHYSYVEFSWLPIKVVIKWWDKDEIYTLDLSKTYLNKGYLSVVAEPVKSMTGIVSNKNIINGEYSIWEYSLLKNWNKIYTLDFGYDQSFTWYNNWYLILKWQRYVNSKNASSKLTLQRPEINILDISNKQDFWIKVVDSKKIWLERDWLSVTEILGYIQ